MVLGLPRPVLCVALVSLDCRLRLLEKIFWIIFQKKRFYLFFFWLLEPVQCLGKTFLYLIFLPSHVKCYPNCQNGPSF